MFFRKPLFNLIGMAEIDAMPGTDIVRAGREQPVVHPAKAAVAFLRDPAVRVEFDGIVGASV